MNYSIIDDGNTWWVCEDCGRYYLSEVIADDCCHGFYIDEESDQTDYDETIEEA